MKNYAAINDSILKEWNVSNQKYGEHNFAPDGIMFRGIFNDYGTGIERLPDDDGSENERWANAPLRILFLTKDQNAGSGDAWDVRGETGDLSYAFFRNLMYQLFGLVNTTTNKKADYEFTKEDAIELYNTFPIARVNVKKEAGKSSITNKELEYYLNRDKSFIREQILNLDADIIVCCGHSDILKEGTGNLLLDFLNNECGFKFERQLDDYWIYYDKALNKIAIDNWHLSVRYSSEKIYDEMIDAYYQFLQIYPDFIKPHR